MLTVEVVTTRATAPLVRTLVPASTAGRVLAVLRLGFLVWAGVALARGDPGDAVALLVMFAVLQAPRLLDLPLGFDAAFLVVWTLQALGQVEGFWGRYDWWDTLVHAALPAVLAPTALVLLIRVGILPDVLHPRRTREAIGALLMVVMIAGAFGAVYEIYEWTSDSLGSTHYQPDNDDTMTDTTANLLGGLAGAIAVMAWALLRERGSRTASLTAGAAAGRT
ncbi:MAG TPA: hypothetical protein VH276_01910 [Solirubrobacteraceae bacterium]|jgi:hypothetical protein|nr:hypothetical protein [Solirubrobacteraceae bacterium]